MPPEDNKFLDQDFMDLFWKTTLKGLNHELFWRQSANRLKHCGDLLFAAHLECHSLSPEEQLETEGKEINAVATFLYGLAMENLLKAALLKKGIAKIESTGEITWHTDKTQRYVTKDHDLLGIWNLLGTTNLDARQKKLMERMAAFVYWAGKYPTPLSVKDIKTNKNFKGLVLSNQTNAIGDTLPLAFQKRDKIMFEEIYQTLLGIFPVEP
jgi:hypothetical protein